MVKRESYLRPIFENRSDRLVDILIGARRVGKTSLIQSVINRLLDQGVAPKDIVFLSADMREVKEAGLREVLDVLEDRFGVKYWNRQVFLFIDEVQELDDWQSDVKNLYDSSRLKLFLSGSSSLILNQKSSKLTGRYLMQKVLPLSFSEYLQFTKKKLNKDTQKNVDILEDYLLVGGYPEYVLNKNQTYLKQAVESTLYRDLLDLYGIRNPRILEDLLHFLADKITTTVSMSRIQKDLNIDDKTAKFYIQYLQDVYLIYPVFRFGSSNKKSKSSSPKYYFNDTGILNLLGIRPRIGHLVENAIFLKLLREQNKTEVPRIYYNVIDNQEVDFRYANGNIEVKYTEDISEEDLNKYLITDENVTFLVKDSNLGREEVYSQNIKYKGVIEFISEDNS